MNSLIKDFRLFTYLPENLFHNIKLLYIDHWSTEKYGLIVTTDDQCYAFGNNLHDMFDEKIKSNLFLIPELSNKGVHQFFSGADCLFAITANQEVYSMGSNYSCLMASNVVEVLRPTKIDFFDDKKIINIRICAKQCYALSSDGLLYGWGDNRGGLIHPRYNGPYTRFPWQGNATFITSPIQLNQSDELIKYIDGIRNTDVFVKVIGDYMIRYRTENGKKILVNCSSKIIKAVVRNDDLFTLNDHGELKRLCGINNVVVMTEVKDILSVSIDIILVLTTNRVVYLLEGEEIKEKEYKSFLQYYLNNNDNQITYKTIEVRGNELYVKDIEVNEEFPRNGQYLKIKDTLIGSTNATDPEEESNESREVIELKQFKFFRDLAHIYDAHVKCYYIWGEFDGFGNFAIFVTQDDRVYSTGDNYNGQLGLGTCQNVGLELEPVYALENKQIEEFFPGKDCIFARSRNGKIYAWGSNVSKQIGMGLDKKKIIPPIEINYFDDKSIIQIQIAKKFCLALSSTGRLYVWFPKKEAFNEVFSEDLVNNKYLLVTFEDGDYRSPRVKYIHCFKEFAFAVTFDELVYWNRQFKYQFDPNAGLILYRFFDVQDISKVVVHDLLEYYHILLLSNKGYVIDYKYDVRKIKGTAPHENWFHYRTYYIGKSAPILDIMYIFRYLYNDEDDSDEDAEFDNLLNSYPVFQTPTYVYELKGRYNQYPLQKKPLFGLSRTEFTNFYEYYTQQIKTMYTTVHMSDDGRITVPQIVVHGDRLEVELKNVYQDKFKTYFEVINDLGQGSYGKVYKVKHRFTQQYFAIKEPFPGNGYSGGSNNIKILHEIKMLSRLKNNSVVKYFTAWVEANVDKENVLYIQMELCSTNLLQILEKRPKAFGRTDTQTMNLLEYYLSWHVFKELIESLAYLHDQSYGKTRIIHCDLKPDNVLITDGSDGKFVKIGDFGLAKFYETDLNEAIFGKNPFRAPELSEESPDEDEKANYNHKVDIYSLGRIGTLLFDVWNTFADVNDRMHHSDQQDIEIDNDQDEDEEIVPPKYRGTNLEATLHYINSQVLYKCLCVDDFNDRPECEQLLEQITRCGIDANVVRSLFPNYLANPSQIRERFFHRFLSNKLQIEFNVTNVEFEPIEEQMETNFISSLLSSFQPKHKRLKLST